MVRKAARKVRRQTETDQLDPDIILQELQLAKESHSRLEKITKRAIRENRKLQVENARLRKQVGKLRAR
jgi:hypothetical protein